MNTINVIHPPDGALWDDVAKVILGESKNPVKSALFMFVRMIEHICREKGYRLIDEST